ncbi:hypothetical protein KIF59_12205 [Enterobacter cloacae subsp. cloacae]|nr:hypothetical protein [Enterobacter cloacae subsp. cloacae]
MQIINRATVRATALATVGKMLAEQPPLHQHKYGNYAACDCMANNPDQTIADVLQAANDALLITRIWRDAPVDTLPL